MSFITLDDRASRIGANAPVSDLFTIPKAFFYTLLQKSGDAASTQSGRLTKVAFAIIAILIPCVVAAAVMTTRAPHPDAPLMATELHPTCSFKRDCWIAALAEAPSSPAVLPKPQAEVALGTPVPLAPAEKASVEIQESQPPAPSFGALVPPDSRWSGPAAALRKDPQTLQAPSRRLSVAMATASGKLKPIAKQAKSQRRTVSAL